jgi:hypothetical protein
VGGLKKVLGKVEEMKKISESLSELHGAFRRLNLCAKKARNLCSKERRKGRTHRTQVNSSLYEMVQLKKPVHDDQVKVLLKDGVESVDAGVLKRSGLVRGMVEDGFEFDLEVPAAKRQFPSSAKIRRKKNGEKNGQLEQQQQRQQQ